MVIEEVLKKAFDPYYKAPIEIWKKFCSLCEEVHYKKNQVIKEENKTGKFGYFLVEGAVGTFIKKKNSYACLDLFLENSFFADDWSLLHGKPSPLEILAIEDSFILRINKTNMEILKNTPIGKTLFLSGEENDNAKRQKKQVDFMSKSAEERYLDILQHNSEILNRIPQKHIASYLGITTQSLSRIKRKIAQ